MKSRIILLLYLVLFLGACQNQESHLEQVNELTIVHLYGDSYEQGSAYGSLLKEDIQQLVERWIKEVEANYERDFRDVVQLLFDSTSYMETVDKTTPHLIDEVRGIAAGCGIDFQTILALQLSEEIDFLTGELQSRACTSLSQNKTSETPTLLAQNMDPPQLFHGKPVLLHFIDRDRSLEKYVFTFPGLIGLCGLNSQGVGVTCNGMSMLNHQRKGLPIAFLLRGVLDCETGKEAFDFIEKVVMSGPQCFTIGSKEEARCYECSANSKQVFYPFSNKKLTLHTNFAAVNRDFNDMFVDLLKRYGKTVDDPYFCPRYFWAYDQIDSLDYQLSLASMKNILSAPQPAIEPISNDNTFGSLIMELGAVSALHIAPGRPDSTKFIALQF